MRTRNSLEDCTSTLIEVPHWYMAWDEEGYLPIYSLLSFIPCKPARFRDEYIYLTGSEGFCDLYKTMRDVRERTPFLRARDGVLSRAGSAEGFEDEIELAIQ